MRGIAWCPRRARGRPRVHHRHPTGRDRPGRYRCERYLRAQAAAIEKAGIRVHVDTTVGYPPYAIEQIAEEHDAALIVIGSHGKGLFVATFSGSVSSDLVRISTRAVALLVVLSALGSSEQSSLVCGRLLSRVLFPTDLTHLSDLAFSHLLRLAPKGLGTVDLLHVVDSTVGNSVDFRRCDAQERLAEMAGALLDAGAGEVRVEVAVGAPDRETARRQTGADHSMFIMAPRWRRRAGQSARRRHARGHPGDGRARPAQSAGLPPLAPG